MGGVGEELPRPEPGQPRIQSGLEETDESLRPLIQSLIVRCGLERCSHVLPRDREAILHASHRRCRTFSMILKLDPAISLFVIPQDVKSRG